MSSPAALKLIQSLPTSGARAVANFTLHGSRYIAIPQLAHDIPEAPAGMNLGDSDTPLIVYRLDETTGRFHEFQRLHVPGGEDAEFFGIGDRFFLATASLRSGKGPYNMNIESTIFEWKEDCFVEFQRIPTFAAKQWHYFKVAGRHFLALAQGVDIPGLASKIPPDSTIFEWQGNSFEPFQTVTSTWGYNWLYFSLYGHDFLAYADHVSPSIVLKWNGERFDHFQTLDGVHGRAFCLFKDGDNAYLAFSRISSDSLVYRWDGKGFQNYHTLTGAGGREFTLVRHGTSSYLFHVRFITGGRHNPNPVLESVIYQIKNGVFKVAATFPTLGGTDVTTFPLNGQTYVIVTESLTKDQRFRTDTHIYRFSIEQLTSLTNGAVGTGFQSPEFLGLFTTYTASKSSIGSELTTTVMQSTSSCPLLVATSFDMLLFPGNASNPSYINFRLNARGFKELAAISHFGPALASFVQMRKISTDPEAWQKHAKELVEKTRAAQQANSEALWRDQINVEAFRGREANIASMVDYACSITIRFLESVLQDPTKLTSEFLQEHYLEATGDALGATVPFNAVMIATFFLVGLDTSYRMRQWLKQYNIDWTKTMVLITGRQGRETSGVTMSTSSVAQVLLQSSDLELPVHRLYLAPHGPVPEITGSGDPEALRQHEHSFRYLWNALYGMSQLGETMFSHYPAYKTEENIRPVINEATEVVSELPKITGPNDWYSMNTRMRVVLEDARQLLSGCVTDYAAEQLRLAGSDVSKVIVPGLDGFDYAYKSSQVNSFAEIPETFTISSFPHPLRTDLPAPIKTFEANGGVLAYRESGARGSSSPIVWVHGLPLDSRFWTAQYDRFSSSYHNIFVDLRGYGSSSKLPTDVTDVTQLYCEDLLAFLEHLQIERANLVGFASAGHVSLRFAALNPSRVNSLVLINGSPRFKPDDTSSDYNFGFSEDSIQNDFVKRMNSNDGLQAICNVVLDPATLFQDLSAEDAAKVSGWTRVMAYNAGLDTLRGFFEHIVHDDDRHLVPQITAPTLLLASSLGKEVPTQTALFLRKHLQHAVLAEVSGAGHFLPVTRPLVVNELIDSFLKTV